MHLILGSQMLIVSAGLAVATYLGVRLLTHSSEPVDRAESSVDAANDITLMGQRQSQPEIRQKTTEIGVKARTLLTQLHDTGQTGSEAEFLVQQYLEQTRRGLEMFQSDRPRSSNARSESLQVLLNLLNTVLERFDNLQTTLDSQDDKALASELKLLTQTLNDLDQISTTIKQGNT